MAIYGRTPKGSAAGRTGLRPLPAMRAMLAARVMLASLLALSVLLIAAWLDTAAAEPKFPPLSGRIVDEAGIIKAEDRAAILEMLRALEEKSTDQIVVYTARTLQGYEIEEFGYRLGRFWQIGQKDKNNGIILIVAPNERKVRIEVGRGLEPQMTDLMSGIIIQNVILPAFRRGDFSGGVRAGVHDIRDVLLGDAEEVKKRALGARKRTGNDDSLWPFALFFGVFVAFVLFSVWQQHKQQEEWARLSPQERQRRIAAAKRARDTNVIIIPSGGGSSGGWSWGSGGGGGDSGWSGGGGDFGGGGSSGSW